jgi:hypothetical protein
VQRAFFLAVVVALLSLLLVVRVDGNAAWPRLTLDGSHLLIFAVVAFTIAVVVGVAIECLQLLTGRPASLFDLGSNEAGAAIGLSLLALHDGAGRRGRLSRAAWWVLIGAAPGAGAPYASVTVPTAPRPCRSKSQARTGTATVRSPWT